MPVINEKFQSYDKKIENLEKEINNLKNENIYLKNKNNEISEENNKYSEMVKQYISNNTFEDIYNPWTEEKDPSSNFFIYKLNEDHSLATIDSGGIYYIKGNYQFIPNKKYKLIYNICYNNDAAFRIGFGELKKTHKRLKGKCTVGLTNEGLFIEGKQFNDVKLKKNNNEIIFIIDLTDNNNLFELIIDKRSFGEYKFSFNSFYSLAAFQSGSVKIKTLISK